MTEKGAIKWFENRIAVMPESETKEMFCMAVAALEKQEQDRWIPVTERLPEEHDSIFAKFKGTRKWRNIMWSKESDHVLVTVQYKNGSKAVNVAKTIDGEWKYDIQIVPRKVLRWRPLPEPYTEEES